MGALLSICFKTAGDDAAANSQLQVKKRRVQKQKSGSKQHLMVDTGRSNSQTSYSSTAQSPTPTHERRPSWGKSDAAKHEEKRKKKREQNSQREERARTEEPAIAPPSPNPDTKRPLNKSISFKLKQEDDQFVPKRKSFRRSVKRK